VRPRHLYFFYIACAFTISSAILSNSLLPYLLTNFIHLPDEEQGGVTGTIATVQELIQLPCMIAAGIISDKLSRRTVFVGGMAMLGIAFCLSPLAQSVLHLYVIRGIFTAIGAGACSAMMGTILADLVVNESRGKAQGLNGLSIGSAAALSATLLSQMPSWYLPLFTEDSTTAASCEARPMDDEATRKAGWATFLTIGASCGLMAMLLRTGLGGCETMPVNDVSISFRKIFIDGVDVARKKRSIRLAFLMAFVSRADVAICATFLPQLCIQYLMEHPPPGPQGCCSDGVCCPCLDAFNQTHWDIYGELHLDPSLGQGQAIEQLTPHSKTLLVNQGIAAAGKLVAILGTSGLIIGPIWGYLCDRCDRLLMVVISLVINCIGYGSMMLFTDKDDPTGSNRLIYLCVTLIGVGEVCAVLSTGLYVQQESPALSRGAVLGMFGVCGGAGIMVNSFISGYLFGHWRRTGPFIYLSMLNLVVSGICVVFWFSQTGDLDAPEVEFRELSGGPMSMTAAAHEHDSDAESGVDLSIATGKLGA